MQFNQMKYITSVKYSYLVTPTTVVARLLIHFFFFFNKSKTIIRLYLLFYSEFGNIILCAIDCNLIFTYLTFGTSVYEGHLKAASVFLGRRDRDSLTRNDPIRGQILT